MTNETRFGNLGLPTRTLMAALCVFAATAGCGSLPHDDDAVDTTNGAIINGTNATPGEFPWQARILVNGTSGCGGSLLAHNWVLTAAHCLVDGSGNPIPPSQLSVVLGDHDMTVTESSEQVRAVAERFI